MPRGPSLDFRHVSTHASLDAATVALHSLDSSLYKIAYNYGTLGRGKVYRCISHDNCPRRLRVIPAATVEQGDSSTARAYNLDVAGEHGTKCTNKKRNGIDMAIRGEVDNLLTEGTSVKRCRLALLDKFAEQPAMLAKIPNEKKLKNRLLTLKKNERSVLKALEEAQVETVGESSDDDIDEIINNQEEEMVEVDLNGDDVESDVDVDAEAGQFDKVKLMRDFAALPGRPVFWSILKKTVFVDNKTKQLVTEWTTGQVIGWVTSEDTPTKWVVRFSDGDKRRLELEELVDEIRAALKLGLNVTGGLRKL